jgi:hypothetical protein
MHAASLVGLPAGPSWPARPGDERDHGLQLTLASCPARGRGGSLPRGQPTPGSPRSQHEETSTVMLVGPLLSLICPGQGPAN